MALYWIEHRDFRGEWTTIGDEPIEAPDGAGAWEEYVSQLALAGCVPQQRAHTVTEVKIEIDGWTGEVYEETDLYRYGEVEVTVDGDLFFVGACVGVEEYNRETARAAGGAVGDMVTAWWADSSDHDTLPHLSAPYVLEALVHASARLRAEYEDNDAGEDSIEQARRLVR